MPVRDSEGAQCRRPHVKWADESDAPILLERSYLDSDGLREHQGLSTKDLADDEWSPPPGGPRGRPLYSSLQYHPSMSPERGRQYEIHDSEEGKLEGRCIHTRGCDDCGAITNNTSRNDSSEQRAVMLRGLENGDGESTRKTAPMHASSYPLPPGSAFIKNDGRTRTGSSSNHATVDQEPKAFARRNDHRPRSRSLSSDILSTVSQQSRERRASTYMARRPLDHYPIYRQPEAMSRSKKREHTPAASLQHSSTAIHEPRARCGCRGITVQVNAGPLGLSLEASYRIDGVVIKQAWSDCAADKGMFRDSVEVQSLPEERCDHTGELNITFESRSSTSGLIKVRDVGIENGTTTGTTTSVVGPPLPLRPGIGTGVRSPSSDSTPNTGVFEGVLEVEEGDILVRVDDVQVSKKSFADAVSLLHREHRPTRLVFVRHACGRRFVRREKCGSCGGKTQQSSCPTPFGRWSCGKRGNGGCGCQLSVGSAQVGHAGTNPSPRKSKKLHHQIEAEADGCPVAALLRTRRSLPHCGMGELYEVVAARGGLWQRLLNNLSPDSHSDRAKLRKLVRSADDHALKGKAPSLSKRRLMNKYNRLAAGKDNAHSHSDTGHSSKDNRALAARVSKDVARTMAPRHAEPPGVFSDSPPGGAGHVCPVHFSKESRGAVFRVAFAAASTLQFVSGMSYMAALMLVQEPVEAVAYATLVTLLQDRTMRTLYPLGDIDLLDAYHLCGGRVVTYCTPNACRSDPCFDRVSVESYGDSYGGDCGLGLGFRGERGVSIDCEDVRDNDPDGTLHDASYGVAATRLPKEKREEEVTQQVVIGDMLPRLVRAFGKALRRRLPSLHKHLCAHAIPMSFLCAEWFTTAYARNTPLPLALCALDLFLVRLDDVMIRLGLAIMEVLAPSLKELNAPEMLLQYGGLVGSVSYKDVLRCMLATQPQQIPLMSSPSGEVPLGTDKSSCALS